MPLLYDANVNYDTSVYSYDGELLAIVGGVMLWPKKERTYLSDEIQRNEPMSSSRLRWN